jgi:CHASE2 domain-containing sensor protein
VQRRGRTWRQGGLIAAAVAVGGLALIVHAVGALSWLEQLSIDGRFSLRGGQPAPRDVAVVALDEASYIRLPRPPLPRGLDADVVRNLQRAGARVVAFDLSLEVPSDDPAGDQALIAVLRRTQGAVVSVTAVAPGAGVPPLAGRAAFTARVRPGISSLPFDSDGAIRRFPSGFHGVEAFSTVAAQLYGGGSARGRPPPPPRALIDYPGPPGTVPTLPIYNVLHGLFSPAAVRGRVVVVGQTASVLGDLHRTPAGGGPMSGPEIQADAVQTALDGFPLRGLAPPVTTLLLLTLAFGVPLASLVLGAPRLDGVRLAGLGLAGALVWTVATQVAFDRGTVVDYADGLFALLGSSGLAWAITTVGEAREHQRLRALFAAHYPEIVSRVLAGSSAGSAPLSATAVIGGYRIEAEIGHGGMGVVYRAAQLQLDRPVALKLIKTEYALDPTYRRRFARESKLAASVSHPNVIPVFNAGEDAGLLYIAMQLVEGPDLSKVLRRIGPLDPVSAIRVVSQLGGALDAAHVAGLVHRDVKPANVLMSAEGAQHVFLTDFGLARQIDGSSALSRGAEWVGTIDYLAPEQITGGHVDGRADVYALTGLLFHCLVGAVPFDRDNDAAKLWAHVHDPRPSAVALRAELPAAIDAVIARGMACDRDARYETAGQLASAAALALGIAQPSGSGLAQQPGNRRPVRTEVGPGDDAPTIVAD